MPLVKCFNGQCTAEKGNGFAFMRSAEQLDPVQLDPVQLDPVQLSCKSSCTLEEKVVRVHVQAKCRQKSPSSGPTAEGRILDTGLHVVL